MHHSLPHYRLLSEVRECRGEGGGVGDREREAVRWRFVLETQDGERLLEAEDSEEGCDEERLALLSVVRGLEALDEPSHVTLTTTNRYVGRGLRFGLAAWRENGWRAERFGGMVRVRDEDLWRRVDRALQFHSLDCRVGRVDVACGDCLPFAPGLETGLAETRVAEAYLRVSRMAETPGVGEDQAADLPCLLAFPSFAEPETPPMFLRTRHGGNWWSAWPPDWRGALGRAMASLAGDRARLVDRLLAPRNGKLRGRGWRRWALLMQVLWRRVVGEPAYTIC